MAYFMTIINRGQSRGGPREIYIYDTNPDTNCEGRTKLGINTSVGPTRVQSPNG